VGCIKEYSDTLLIFLLKAHRPKKYRERYDVRIRKRLETNVVNMTDAELEQFISETKADPERKSGATR